MKFERGKDPKEALGIGLQEKLRKNVRIIVEKYKFNLANKKLRKDAEEELSKMVNMPVKLSVRKDFEAGEWELNVNVMPEKATARITHEVNIGEIRRGTNDTGPR